MKNSLLGLIAIVLFSFNCDAQKNNDFNQKSEFIRGSLITLFNKEKIEYKFKSLDQLSEGIEEIIKELNFESLENDKNLHDITIEVKLEITVGIETILISESIKTSCATESASQAVRRIKTLLSTISG